MAEVKESPVNSLSVSLSVDTTEAESALQLIEERLDRILEKSEKVNKLGLNQII